MGDTADVKQFGYRTPRYSFPQRMNLEITQDGTTRVIAAQGIDISAHGIAISTSELFPVAEPVILAIPCGEGEMVRIAGRMYYHSEDHYGFAFEFRCPEQSQQVQDLVSRFAMGR